MNSLRLYPYFLLTNYRTAVEMRGHRQIFYRENKSVIHNIYPLNTCPYHKEVIKQPSEESH